MLGEVGWGILNGSIVGDEEGEYTFTGGKASTVIDYVLADEVSRKEIKSMIVEDRVESDHHPLVVTVRGVGREVGRRQRRGKGGGSRGRWSEKMKEEFCRGMSEVELVQEDVQERVKELTGRVMEEIRRSEEKGGRKKGQRREGWWDVDCKKKRAAALEERSGDKRGVWREEGGIQTNV
ncbi:hypothetical protein M0802_016592 [Mischocyttarus mexicanus]|nr:hypothetical protein M0802_016592 [Mischocyttarus mexicanus]